MLVIPCKHIYYWQRHLNCVGCKRFLDGHTCTRIILFVTKVLTFARICYRCCDGVLVGIVAEGVKFPSCVNNACWLRVHPTDVVVIGAGAKSHLMNVNLENFLLCVHIFPLFGDCGVTVSSHGCLID